MKTPPLVTVVGPTASGKSAFAMWLAQQYKGEIICADSRTVYKGMDIGTAKPTLAERQAVPHHLLDVVKPGEQFSAAQFKTLAIKAIGDSAARGKLPITVGGTGLYIDSVLFDYAFGAPANRKLREELQSMSIKELQNRCKEDNIKLPVNQQNKRHLIRAIELGGSVADPKTLRSNTLVVGIATDRQSLKLRIEQRAHDMVRQGIVEEVTRLSRTYGWDNEAMKGIIYSTFRQVVENTKPLHVALEEVVTHDMQLAKRQLTWLKRNSFIQWGTPDELKSIVRNFLVHIGYIGN